jgi:hypothetical protein
MEYAAGGELFERICNAGRFSEDEVSNSLFTYSSYFLYSFKVNPILSQKDTCLTNSSNKFEL